jgi:heterotetrameric sarcosine oxidase gamma subunit
MEEECVVRLPEKLSPLHDLAVPRTGPDSVTLSERLCDSLVQVQAWPDSVPKVKKKIDEMKKGLVVMETGPGRWMIEGEEAGLDENLRAGMDGALAAVTDLTHARVVVSISGARSDWVLASGIALDFHAEAFPVGATQLGHHHEIGLTIHRTGSDSYDLYVFTSLVRSFWHWIEKASGEVGFRVI